MIIPEKLKEILERDQKIDGLVKTVISSFEPIFKNNDLFFFEEYTDHGIEHINKVLKTAEFLIPDTLLINDIQSKEVAILILATVLHDIGMHTNFATFRAIIDGKYNDVKVNILDKKTWQELWQEYLLEVRHWSSKKLENVFGKPETEEDINIISIVESVKSAIESKNKDKLDGRHKKLIGEFIRRHHERLAHEIALNGFIGNETILFGNETLDERYKQLVGIVARSHGMNVRKTYEFLKEEMGLGKAWKNPDNIKIVYLMVLLRIADVLQIDETRANRILLEIEGVNSYASEKEHKKHLTILNLNCETEDPEMIYVECNSPKNAELYVEIQNLIKYIQYEFDLSWAILGEVYGLTSKTQIKFRRIDSNLENQKLNYVPKKIAFDVNNEVAKLLVAPLYGNNPTYGVRELVQNATDACKERMKIEQDNGNTDYEPLITVSIDKIEEEKYSFKIKDNGKGMTLDEIQNYFLSVGSSFRKTIEWKKEFEEKVSRNGKFGIGVLAIFLLGEEGAEISVKTRSYQDKSSTYTFKTKIDNEYIDISIEQNNLFEIGTEIQIFIPKNKCEKLIKSANPKWTDWYIGDTPKVQYFLCGNKIKKQSFFKQQSKREISSKGYKVQWCYDKIKDDGNDNEESTNRNMFVSCNDIIVTLDSNYYEFSDVTINRKPNLFIEDTQGKLPLKLNRNDIDVGILPFESELLQDIYKDIIAELLMLSKKPYGKKRPHLLYYYDSIFSYKYNIYNVQ